MSWAYENALNDAKRVVGKHDATYEALEMALDELQMYRADVEDMYYEYDRYISLIENRLDNMEVPEDEDDA